MSRIAALSLVTMLVAACAQTPPERQFVEEAATALGGTERLLAIRTLAVEGGGMNGAMGGSVASPWAEFCVLRSGLCRCATFRSGRLRTPSARSTTSSSGPRW